MLNFNIQNSLFDIHYSHQFHPGVFGSLGGSGFWETQRIAPCGATTARSRTKPRALRRDGGATGRPARGPWGTPRRINRFQPDAKHLWSVCRPRQLSLARRLRRGGAAGAAPSQSSGRPEAPFAFGLKAREPSGATTIVPPPFSATATAFEFTMGQEIMGSDPASVCCRWFCCQAWYSMRVVIGQRRGGLWWKGWRPVLVKKMVVLHGAHT